MVKMDKTNLKILKPLILLIIGIVIGIGLVSGYYYITETKTDKTQSQIIENITPEEAFNLIENNRNNPNFVILDLRAPEDFAEGHIENAINIDYNSTSFSDILDVSDRNKMYLVYCKGGNRSWVAMQIMKELGFKEVYNMLGGIMQWEEEGFETVGG